MPSARQAATISMFVSLASVPRTATSRGRRRRTGRVALLRRRRPASRGRMTGSRRSKRQKRRPLGQPCAISTRSSDACEPSPIGPSPSSVPVKRLVVFASEPPAHEARRPRATGPARDRVAWRSRAGPGCAGAAPSAAGRSLPRPRSWRPRGSGCRPLTARSSSREPQPRRRAHVDDRTRLRARRHWDGVLRRSCRR